MKRRWAQRGGATSLSAASINVVAKPRKSGGMSAQGKKNIAAAMKKRWAEKKRKAL
jgi:hypothetical protein